MGALARLKAGNKIRIMLRSNYDGDSDSGWHIVSKQLRVTLLMENTHIPFPLKLQNALHHSI